MRRPTARRSVALAVALLLLVGVLTAASLAVGARHTPLDVVWQALLDPTSTLGDHLVVRARIARTVDALVVGAALGLAGSSMQGITRNPLADPGILGVNAGAAAAIVLVLSTFQLSGVTSMAVAGTLGALGAFALVYAVAAAAPGGAQPIKLALVGAAINAGLSSVTSGWLLLHPAALERFRFWQVGTLGVRGLSELPATLWLLGGGAALCLAGGRSLNLMALGDDAASALGSRVQLARTASALGAALLAGTSTALVGPVAFVGLVVPHVLRLWVGTDYRALLPMSLLAGPVLLLAADTVGRVIAPPGEVQVGIMTAIVGAPVMIALVRGRGRVSL
ncbi:FecCD family ABC transporter permease [Tessaracoccus antarcticus]|uniref:Iron ABC transporter permease n=1 Tax=Tessaracoccus antarcticus TaxID=2479848 RepID=A0A3M0FZQ8_9ACTN|nr:iron ABC transporter permease [Tessaracoccus antarcticus]RMB58170.1 iron ABC transporter permease [Tessaracoccus antarcticus]